MTPKERKQRIDELFEAALGLEASRRDAFLKEACAGDEPMRWEVESLIAAHQKADAQNFIVQPVFDLNKLLEYDRPALEIGQNIGCYKILRPLGGGGGGEVYLAEDVNLGCKRAIKILLDELLEDDHAKRRFMGTAQLLATLDHPNICAIHAVVEEGDRSFIVMQYVEGQTLDAIIKSGPLSVQLARDFGVQIAEALKEAHSRGIIHRDIKPQNIMVTPRGQVKVLDFGLAKVFQPHLVADTQAKTRSLLTDPGAVVGTVPYMSPEQAKGAPVDARSDLFSLGAVLYKCVAGRPAFSGDDLEDIYKQVIEVNPPPPSQFNPRVPRKLDSIILRALAKNPDERYQSADEMIADLNSVNLLDTLLPRAAEALIGALRRPRVFIPAILVVLVFLAVLLWRPGSPHQPPPEAIRWYKEGTAALREGLYYKASKALNQAVNIDDGFALAHARLAEALTELDYTDKAKDEIIRAESLVPDHSTLAPLEGLYLQAVTKIVLQELAHAIESYHEIARQVPETEKPQAYLDLGRAYEKDDQLDKAKENYEKAAKLDPQDAAAFLRLGVLYAQQQDFAGAAEAFDKAESLHQILNNIEGLTEVLYQRGLLYSNLGNLAEARAQLQKALDMARTIDNNHQRIRTLLELSRVSYTGGETIQAQEYATEALNLAQANEMENLSTHGLIEIGNALRVSGDYAEAERYLRQALEFAQRDKGRRNEARALVSLGALRITLHDADQGSEYIKQALPFYEKGGYRREASLAFYQLGRAYELKGESDAARQASEQQFQLAQRSGDRSHLALAHRGIALALVYQERYPEALRHFEESYSIYNSLGNQLFAGNRLIDCGDMLWRLGHYQEARVAFDGAVSIANHPAVRNRQMLNSLSLAEAYMELSKRRPLEAITKGNRARDLNAGNQHAVEAEYVIGLARSLLGAKHDAVRICGGAVTAARRTTYPPILSGALLALAETSFEDGDAQGALRNALEAQARFASARQQESEWRAWLIAARASLRAGDAMKAHEYATRAEGLLSNLEEKWGAEAYNSYLTRPDVRYYRRHLAKMLAANQ